MSEKKSEGAPHRAPARCDTVGIQRSHMRGHWLCWDCTLESGANSPSRAGRHGSGPLHGWLFGTESVGAGSAMVGRALQGSCETGSPWSFVCVPPATRAGPSVLTTRRRTATATHRVLNVNTGTRRDTSNRTNRRPGGPQCPQRSSHIRRTGPLPWTALAHDLVSGSTPAEPSRSTAWSIFAASCRLCPGAGERPPSDSSASRGERLAHRAGAPAAARVQPRAALRLSANKQKREIAMSAANAGARSRAAGGASRLDLCACAHTRGKEQAVEVVAPTSDRSAARS
jgi:hypothetical protein